MEKMVCFSVICDGISEYAKGELKKAQKSYYLIRKQHEEACTYSLLSSLADLKAELQKTMSGMPTIFHA